MFMLKKIRAAVVLVTLVWMLFAGSCALGASVPEARSRAPAANPLYAPVDGTSSLWAAYLVSGQRSYRRGDTADAERLFKQALSEVQSSDPDGDRVVESLHTLGALYRAQRRFKDAREMYGRALAVTEKTSGPFDQGLLMHLGNLAGVCTDDGRHEEAENLYRRILTIWEEAAKPDKRALALAVCDLAQCLQAQERNGEIHPLAARAAALAEELKDSSPGDTISIWQALSVVLCREGKGGERDALRTRAIELASRAFGRQTPVTASLLIDDAQDDLSMGAGQAAEAKYKEALAIYEASGPAYLPEAADTMHKLGELAAQASKLSDAEQIFYRLVALRSASLASDRLGLVVCLEGLTDVLARQNKCAQAEPYLRRMVRACSESPGTIPKEKLVQARERLCDAYSKTGKQSLAKPVLLELLEDYRAMPAVAPARVADCWTSIALAEVSNRDYVSADRAFRAAIEFNERATDTARLADTLEAYGAMLEECGREGWASHIGARARRLRSEREPARALARGGGAI